MSTDYAAWVGRQEQQHDVVVPGPLDRLAATLDRDDPPFAAGDAAPPLAHWILFLPQARHSSLGPDGHPARGGFLPPVHHLPRRMWAGGRLRFHAPLRVGMALTRTSTIAEVTRREGASGELIFVTVRHELREDGQDAVLLTEEHDIVYRSADTPAVKSAPAAPPPGDWQRQIVPDAVMLFRYSALTFNGHRIHYDRDYVTREEGYPGLIVHGPLTATLLLDLVRRQLPQATVTAFSFRALSPLFDGAPVTLHGTAPDAEGRITLWATNPSGGLAMRGEARIA
ncbi:FAS1-like dehydratase domain-containing protein [Teichococcus oryzae]|uniref:Acyl-CoA dehydrogenase n=1 Tax=Teichococcus oryzae TaxID=1608942 RepID=A0A5B2TDY6_9PROT|nr:MaoC family dehydratase N-terminal domain-containing protein [Pseudoroseomonas oryzae]KAA2212369.1 acyl-CoA dehydrogenase [Pseudoroseomonas oryzae]